MLLIIDNGNNIFLYEKIIPILKNRYKKDVLYITLSKNKANYINEIGGVALYLKDVEYNNEYLQKLFLIEESQHGFTLNQCIFSDRILKYKKTDDAVSLLNDYAVRFISILEKYNISAVIGEISWGVELLFFNICKFYNIKYINPLNVYIQSVPKLVFFDDKHTDVYFKINKSSSNKDLSDDIKNRTNIDINDTIGKSLQNVALSQYAKRGFISWKFRDDYEYRDGVKIKFRRIKVILKKHILKIIRSYFYDQLDNKKYIYFPLHVQPEATPDVVAVNYSNQLEIVKQVARSLPINTRLVVKEHPNAIGSLPIREVFEIKKIHNVIYCDPNNNSMSLIKNSFCVVTIAGTAAVEGRLCDKPVIFFSDKFYSEKLEHVYTEYNFNNLPKLIKSFSNPKSDYACKDANSFNSYISSISRDCYIYDPIIYPHVLCEDNIIKLAESINEMVYYGEK